MRGGAWRSGRRRVPRPGGRGACWGGFTGVLHNGSEFGASVTALGDLDRDGVATIDFASGDDQAHTALVNGQDVSSPSEFSRTIHLSSSGPNLGPAIFDSTPQGPNERSQDRDLLVGLGNIIILENSRFPTQTVPGIFDRPSDDRDGGTFSFTFAHGPVEPLSLDVVAIHLGTVHGGSVAHFDAANRLRIYEVPAGWTRDGRGRAGFRTLDLTTLDPQPGFRTSAVAVETPGFDPGAVVHLEVQLGSSGAVDNLRWDPHPDS